LFYGYGPIAFFLRISVLKILSKSFQNLGYDFETTSAFSIIIGTFKASGANAIAMRWSL